MKLRFVSFKNGRERYLFKVDNLSSVALRETDLSGLILEITSIDGRVDEIEVANHEVANNIIYGIICAINSEDRVYIIDGVGK